MSFFRVDMRTMLSIRGWERYRFKIQYQHTVVRFCWGKTMKMLKERKRKRWWLEVADVGGGVGERRGPRLDAVYYYRGRSLFGARLVRDQRKPHAEMQIVHGVARRARRPAVMQLAWLCVSKEKTFAGGVRSYEMSTEIRS